MTTPRIELLQACMKRLGTNGYDQQGVPTLDALRALSGLQDITPKERDEAFRLKLFEDFAESAPAPVSKIPQESPAVEALDIVEGDDELADAAARFQTADDLDAAIGARDLEKQNAYALVRHYESEVKRADSVFADALLEWQTKGRSKLTQKDLIRQVNEAERKHKADVAEGRALLRHVASMPQSIIDRVAQGMSGGVGARQAGGNSFRRGAMPQNFKGHKPPSER